MDRASELHALTVPIRDEIGRRGGRASRRPSICRDRTGFGLRCWTNSHTTALASCRNGKIIHEVINAIRVRWIADSLGLSRNLTCQAFKAKRSADGRLKKSSDNESTTYVPELKGNRLLEGATAAQHPEYEFWFRYNEDFIRDQSSDIERSKQWDATVGGVVAGSIWRFHIPTTLKYSVHPRPRLLS